MGLGFTIDTPLKVSAYGIDSVISLCDDMLIERIRKMYCVKYGITYEEISDKTIDFRAKRVTAYLNLMHDLSVRKFEELKNSHLAENSEVMKYINMRPCRSSINQQIDNPAKIDSEESEKVSRFRKELNMGSIDVNIMTKLDKDNYLKKEKLPTEYNDAHAALRGFANSKLSSSIIFSAGMNPRLFSYLENFEDFYPDETGKVKKKIVLKVSDYRSAFIQGKFLAKKGLWVSEYRIESGLNCGGHAFATDGFLMGPILAEFRDKRSELVLDIHDILVKALLQKNRIVPKKPLALKITAQGGVGTAEEHQFLLDHYQVDSVGWGTPFLLVPEVTNVDEPTLKQLMAAKEVDLYLSQISPLGLPFNSLKGNSKDAERNSQEAKG